MTVENDPNADPKAIITLEAPAHREEEDEDEDEEWE